MDKGAITDSHVLVLPIEHFPSSLHLSASTYTEMERYLSALRSCFAAQVRPPPSPPTHGYMGAVDLPAHPSIIPVSAALLHCSSGT